MNTRLRVLGLFGVLTVLVLSGCGGDGERSALLATPATVSPLTGTSWTLISLQGISVATDPAITLAFPKEGQFNGMAVCNLYATETYTATTAGELSIAPIWTTLKGCPESGGRESAYLAALGHSVGYRITGDQLELLDDTGSPHLVYTRYTLAGSQWRLITFNGTPVDPEWVVTLAFTSVNQLAGQDDCHFYGSHTYIATAGGGLSIREITTATFPVGAGPPTVTTQTMLGCPEDGGTSAYLTALGDSVGYRISPEQLELLDAAGTPHLVFERV